MKGHFNVALPAEHGANFLPSHLQCERRRRGARTQRARFRPLALDLTLLWIRARYCTLGASEVEALVGAIERLLRRYRAARVSGSDRALDSNLVALFWIFYEAIERCVDVGETDCICSWRRRIEDAEQLTTFLVNVVRAYWSSSADRDWMFRDLERLACRANDVAERDGSISRRPEGDESAEARADRLSILLFDAANDLACNNWAREEWMWIVPAG